MDISLINGKTKLRDLAEAYPWLIGEVRKQSKRAALLDPALIRMMIRRTTVSDAAKKAGMTEEDLICRLKQAIAEHETK